MSIAILASHTGIEEVGLELIADHGLAEDGERDD